MVDDELVVDNEVDEDVNHFSWEGIYARPWEAVVEAADGSLAAAGSSRKRSRVGARDVQLGVKRGVLRAIFLIVDASRAASEADPDMKPTRLAAMVESASRLCPTSSSRTRSQHWRCSRQATAERGCSRSLRAIHVSTCRRSLSSARTAAAAAARARPRYRMCLSSRASRCTPCRASRVERWCCSRRA